MDNDDEMDEPRTLRPTTWDDYVGQETLTTQLRVKCQAAFKLAKPLGHLLISGTPGSGKTTLAQLAASETGDTLAVISRPVNENDLMQVLWDLPGGRGIVFIDEAHRQPKKTQEGLLTLCEEGYIQTRWGTEHFDWLTVIFATTDKRKLDEALQSRCTILNMRPYTADEMVQIVEGMAERANVPLDRPTCEALAAASNGVPRAARHLVLAAQEIDAVGQPLTVDRILTQHGVEADGLTEDHLEYMRTLLNVGGQAGLEVLSTRLGLHRTQLQRVERLLVDRGYIRYASQGRVLTGVGRGRLDGRALAS